MTTSQAVAAFFLAASVLTLTPGVDTAMVLRSAAVKGVKSAAYASSGVVLGCLVWGVAASAGLGALLAASPAAFSVLKWGGAAYLLYIGLKLLLKPRRAFDAAPAQAADANGHEMLKQGFLTNLLNPKIGVFYVTFLPQFIPAGAEAFSFSLLLAGVHGGVSALWFAVLIAATAPLGRVLKRPAVIRALDRVTGAVFVALGLRLAFLR